MKKPSSRSMTGTLQQLLFSPKGKLEGLLMTEHNKSFQITLEPDTIDAAVMQNAIGQRLQLKAVADISPKTEYAAHPVYRLKALNKIGGKSAPTMKSDSRDATVKGIVAAIHFAKHGEPNGIVLDTGELIHLRPHGMEQCKLAVGSAVSVRGERRTTVLGTPLIEARHVNRYTLE